MTIVMRCTAALPALLILAACGSDPQPGGVTAGESKALNEAAAMLDAQRLPEGALKPAPQLAQQPAPASQAAQGTKP